MSWHKVILEQKQPLHLGLKKHGVISETRIFITGQIIWGALTNAYGKIHNWDKDDYENVENRKIFEKISCFYPLIEKEELLPKYFEGELYLGNLSEKKFRQKYVTTLVSTAINPIYRSAKDESLHELDVIIPKSEDGKSLQWIGYVECETAKLKEFYDIYLGGDVKYGLGKVKIKEFKAVTEYHQNPIKGKIEIDQGKQSEQLKNFLKFDQQKFKGKIELLAEYNFTKNSPKVTQSQFYITPGSKLN